MERPFHSLTQELVRATLLARLRNPGGFLEGSMERTISIPVSVLRKVQSAARATEEAQDALEDFLLAQDPRFLQRMRAARASHRSHRTKPFTAQKRS
jgi:hypothetical protein